MVMVLVLFLFLPACGGSKIKKANYDKINTGMSEQEVEAILGPGSEEAAASAEVPELKLGGGTVEGVKIPEAKIGGLSLSAKRKVWKDGTKTVTVQFVNGKVTGKSQQGL